MGVQLDYTTANSVRWNGTPLTAEEATRMKACAADADEECGDRGIGRPGRARLESFYACRSTVWWV
jgi:hypothetical protein